MSQGAADSPSGRALLVSLLLGSLGLLVVVPAFILPLWSVVEALDWAPVACTITESRLGGYSEDGSTSWSVVLRYSYRAPDPAAGGAPRDFTGDRASLTGGWMVGKGPKQLVVDANPAGATRTCWHDPRHPERSVFDRRLQLGHFLGLGTLFLPLLGFWIPLARRRGKLAVAGILLAWNGCIVPLYLQFLLPPYGAEGPDLGFLLGFSPFVLLGLLPPWLLRRRLRAARGAAPPARPSHYVRAGDDGEVKRLYRVTSGRAECWERFEWRPLDEPRHDRIMRQVYFGLEDLDRLPDAEVWKAQAALRARAVKVTRAWRLRTAGPVGLDEVQARLAPLGIAWTRIDSDSRSDLLAGFATGAIHLRILHVIGIGLFQLELTVWKEEVEGFDAAFEEARAWVFDELVARLEPIEVATSLPEER